jgi:hypothetical protein
MALQTARRLVALAGCGSLALALQVPARGADPTFTKITTPSGRHTVLVDRGTPQITVAGTASSDVTTVNVYCVRGTTAPVDATPVANGVPVTSDGGFTVTVPVPGIGASGPICRLRALPDGVGPNEATSSYAGPLLDIDVVSRTTKGTDTMDFRLSAGRADGPMTAASAGKCGDSSMAVVPAGLSAPVASEGCVASLGPGAAVGTTGSLRVDGHLALLPYSVLAYTDGTSPLTLHVHAAKSGEVRWTESATLVRCQDTDVYPPPSPGQCGSVVATGLRFHRTGTFVAGGHQIRLRDSFSSIDGHRHRVRAIYGMESTAPVTGGLGFDFPGRVGGFHSVSSGQVVTGLPTRASTILVRTDRFAVEGDPQASTRAITWSRTPRRLGFSSDDPTVFGMGYTLDVPRNGAARLGFTDSQATLTSSAARLGKRAAGGMMSAPRITSPSTGAPVTGTKTVVKGVVRAGANGLPVTVTVNGHAATLRDRSATRATYKVVFDEPLGKHVLTAVARDAGGNQRSTSITVRNK